MAREPRLTGKPLNPEEYGYVMGGPVRAVEVAIAALVEHGTLRVSREGGLSSTGQPHGLSRLEAEILEALGGNVLPVPKVIHTVAPGAAVRELAAAVSARGLGPQKKRWFARRQPPPTRSVLDERLAGAGLLPVMMLGTIPAAVAIDGFGAYPDEDLASGLLAGKASAVGGVYCSYVWSDDQGSGPAGWGPDAFPYVGCASTGGGFSVGGSSCGGSSGCGGGGGCGGGS